MQALTHHEIIGLVGPFTRRGRHVDLAASNRLERRLAFRPVERADASPLLHEALQLENPDQGLFRLTRLLTLAGGLQASLVAEGPDPGALLSLIEGIEPARQFHAGNGFLIARCHRLEKSASADTPPSLILTRAAAQLDGWRLLMNVSRVTGIAAELELQPCASGLIELPDDLLAVLGWSWSRLVRVENGWRSDLRLRGSDGARSADAQTKFDRSVLHLAQTFAEPPLQFHQQRLRARWAVVFRRSIPLLGSLGLIAAAAAVPSLNLAQDSVFRMLIFHAPPLLLAAFFCMRELPRIEIPPLPRPATAPAWRNTGPTL